ncbi:MAG: PEP-CTERM sorting domain-containing protein [Thiobacillaceae bacterium]|jgi:hypothetical protein|nr:PEP-CTERM sorting domain-containing protein [Thiobacillaceae bacterium]
MKSSLLSLTVAGLFAGVTLATNANAATFSDRASFDAAVVNMTTLDFEGVIGTPGFDANYSMGTGHMASSITLAGVRFSDVFSGGSGDFVYILANDGAGASGSLNDTTAVWLGRSSSRITLPAGMTAFGSDYGVPIGVPGGLPLGHTTTIQATFHFRGNPATETFALPVTGKSQFFGYSGAEIDYIDLTGSGIYMVFDNMSIAQAVPEPETYALLLAGLGLVGFAARRRR